MPTVAVSVCRIGESRDDDRFLDGAQLQLEVETEDLFGLHPDRLRQAVLKPVSVDFTT